MSCPSLETNLRHPYILLLQTSIHHLTRSLPPLIVPWHHPTFYTSHIRLLLSGFPPRFFLSSDTFTFHPSIISTPPLRHPRGGVLLCAAPGNLPVPWRSPPWPERPPSAACWSPPPAGLPACSAGRWVARCMWWGLRLFQRCMLSQLQRKHRGRRKGVIIEWQQKDATNTHQKKSLLQRSGK